MNYLFRSLLLISLVFVGCMAGCNAPPPVVTDPSVPPVVVDNTAKIATNIKIGTSSTITLAMVAISFTDDNTQTQVQEIASLSSKIVNENVLPILNGDFYFVDAAYAAFYRIRERNNVDFNLYGGSHFIFTSEGTMNITGGGIGFDFQMKDFCINLNTGYGIYTLSDNLKPPAAFMFYPTGEIGLFYKL